MKPSSKRSSTFSRVSPRHSVLSSLRHCHRSDTDFSRTSAAMSGLVVVRHQSHERYSVTGPQGPVSRVGARTGAGAGAGTGAVVDADAAVGASAEVASVAVARTRRAAFSMMSTHQSINVTGPL